MNPQVKLTVAALAGLLAGSTMTVLVSGHPVDLTPPVQLRLGAVEVSQADLIYRPITAAMAKAGAVEVICQAGAISNHPDRIYCADDKTAGFLLPKLVAEDLAGAVEMAFGPGALKAPRLQLDGNKLYLNK